MLEVYSAEVAHYDINESLIMIHEIQKAADERLRQTFLRELISTSNNNKWQT